MRAARRRPGRVPRHRGPAGRASTSTARTAAHRSRSGRNEECGLRCLYHGWKIDVEGNVIDTPVGAARRRSCAEARQAPKAYPCREAGGFVWVWMGAAATRCVNSSRRRGRRRPGIRTSIVKMHVGCNWAQVLEGAIDSAHSSSLHATDMVPAQRRRRRRDRAASGCGRRPTRRRGCRSQRTDFGFRYVAIRHPIENAATHDYLRITLFVAPFTVLIPPNDSYQLVDPQHPDRRHQHDVLLHRLERGRGHRPGRRGASSARREVGIDLDAQLPQRSAPVTTTTCRTATR